MVKSKRTRWRAFELTQDQQPNSIVENAASSQREASKGNLHDQHKFRSHQFSTQDDSNLRHKSYKDNNKYPWQRKAHTPYPSDATNRNEDREPLKFNEDEFIRICTPRSDLLFKKGYLSKLVTDKSQLTESYADERNSKQVLESTMSPNNFYHATTATAFTQELSHYVYYEPMYNGYNFVPSNDSSQASQFYFMPYSCQFDPIFVPYETDDNTEIDKFIEAEVTEDLEQERFAEEQMLNKQYQFEANLTEVEKSGRNRRRKRPPHARNIQLTRSSDSTSEDDDTISEKHIWVENQKSDQYHFKYNADVEEFHPKFHPSPGDQLTEAKRPLLGNHGKDSDTSFEVNERDKKNTKDPITSKASEDNVSHRNTKTGAITRVAEDIKTDARKKSFKTCSTKVVLSKNSKQRVKSKRGKQFIGRQDGFEIIEPDFSKKPKKNLQVESIPMENHASTPDSDDEEASDCMKDLTTRGYSKKAGIENLTSPSSNGKNNLEKSRESSIDRCDIATLERELIENLRLFDEDIDLKSPLINKIIDFPITSAVINWMRTLPNESLDLWNIGKISVVHEDDDNASEISDFHSKSETDSDYLSDFQTKNSSPTSTKTIFSSVSKKHEPEIHSESYCALM